MWCLARLLPLMIGEFIPEDDEHWKLYITFLTMMNYIFSPNTNEDNIAYARYLIENHHIGFCELYPNCSCLCLSYFSKNLKGGKQDLSKSNSGLPSACAKALAECEELFSNIYILLVLACTLQVTSCECERNASVLRRLNNFMRASMNESRLTSLALMLIHYDKVIDLDRVVDLFSQAHPRRGAVYC